MPFLGVFDFPTLSFVAAILAALSAALLFVRGAIVGAATLLGLGLGLSGFAGDVERDDLMGLAAGLLTPLVLVPLEFVSAARRTDVERVPATEAGRVRPFKPEVEGVRLSTGGLWRRTGDIVRLCWSIGQGRTYSWWEEGRSLSRPGVQHFGWSSERRWAFLCSRQRSSPFACDRALHRKSH